GSQAEEFAAVKKLATETGMRYLEWAQSTVKTRTRSLNPASSLEGLINRPDVTQHIRESQERDQMVGLLLKMIQEARTGHHRHGQSCFGEKGSERSRR